MTDIDKFKLQKKKKRKHEIRCEVGYDVAAAEDTLSLHRGPSGVEICCCLSGGGSQGENTSASNSLVFSNDEVSSQCPSSSSLYLMHFFLRLERKYTHTTHKSEHLWRVPIPTRTAPEILLLHAVARTTLSSIGICRETTNIPGHNWSQLCVQIKLYNSIPHVLHWNNLTIPLIWRHYIIAFSTGSPKKSSPSSTQRGHKAIVT